MPKAPPHLKIQRAKAFVDDTGRKVLTECEECGKEKYIVEGQRSAMSVDRSGGSGKERALVTDDCATLYFHDDMTVRAVSN